MEGHENLLSEVSAIVDEARATLPAIHVDRGRFVESVLAKIAGAADPAAALRTLRVADLYLAFASASGDEQAVAELARSVGALATDLRPKFTHLPETWDDITQRFLRAMVVPSEERPPKILDYAGTGDLRAWLRVALSRFLLNVASREGRERPEDLPFFEALSDGSTSAEADYLRAACGAELRASLEVSAQALTARERALLRFAYADGKTVQEIGAVYGVHGATASRWVQKARERLATLVHDDLTQRLKLSNSEATSLLRGALSQFDLTLDRLLAG
jgi:RNA polymerase sigma-70 factor (ECF subfamily)